MAQADYFLKLDGIDGESTDDKHKGEIEIQSFSWGLSQTGGGRPGGGGGGGAGKVSVQDFHFVAQTGIQSPLLFLATATGEHFKKATLTVRKSFEKQQPEFLKIEMKEVLISSYQVGGTDAGDDGIPRDQFSLNFSKIEMSVTQPRADGTAGKTVTAGYDVKANVKI